METPEQSLELRLHRILRLLMKNATVVVSGTKIAEELGLTRSEVWRMIQLLRATGVEVAGHPSTGYRLKSAPDLLLSETVSPLVKGTVFENRIQHFFKIGSTNTEAMSAAVHGAKEGNVFLAEEQTAGRGRGGHTWTSTSSAGIYCSVLLRPALPPSDVLVMALAAALAVRTAIKLMDDTLDVDLKWPNDVLLKGKKVCGILAEMNAEATRVRHIVIGIGINVNQRSFPSDLQTTATSLQIITGRPWSRVELVAALLKSLDQEYRALSEVGTRRAILRRFSQRSSWIRGKRVRVEENGAVLEGTTEGLDSQGFLQVRAGEHLQKVLSGTVREIV